MGGRGQMDITICRNTTCPWKEECYRFTAKPGENQSYAYIEYREYANGCGKFIPIDERGGRKP
jgi:hypothetical protein